MSPFATTGVVERNAKKHCPSTIFWEGHRFLDKIQVGQRYSTILQLGPQKIQSLDKS